MDSSIVVQTPRGPVTLPSDFERADKGHDPVISYHAGRMYQAGVVELVEDRFKLHNDHWSYVSVTLVGASGREVQGCHMAGHDRTKNPLYMALPWAVDEILRQKAVVAYVFGFRRDGVCPPANPQGVLLPTGDGEPDLLAVLVRKPAG